LLADSIVGRSVTEKRAEVMTLEEGPS
jgi:hypothetical protein